MSRLKAAVIGLGMMGERHARIWAELPYTTLAAVYDILPERAAKIAATYGCMAAASLEEAVNAGGIDIVSVCTDDQAHVEACCMAANAGKHIIVEKPLATSIADCDAIIAAADDNDVRLMVGHVVRFDPRYQVAKSAIDAGAVGEIVQVYGRRNNVVTSGRRIGLRTSVAYFLGVHDLDIMRWFTGGEAIRVYAESARKVLTEEGTDDSIFTLIKYDNGAAGCLETCWVIPTGQPNSLDARVEVVGTLGRVAVRVGEHEPVEVSTSDHSSRPDIAYGPVFNGQQGGALRLQLEHFARCILDERDFLISPHDARAAVVIAAAIHTSLETNLPVDPSQL